MNTLLMTPADVAVLETFVVPRYLTAFGNVLMDMLLVGDGANIAHLGCRTGFPNDRLIQKIPTCHVVGVDTSPHTIELARNKAASAGRGSTIQYVYSPNYPTPLRAEEYSHAMSLHPVGNHLDRQQLFAEMKRLVYPQGQLLVAMPLRGSFQELSDLFLEYALKEDQGQLGQAVVAASAARPSIETLADELEEAGLVDVDVEVVRTQLTFAGGHAFLQDPTTRLFIEPDWAGTLPGFELAPALTYVSQAIDVYWAESEFQLTVMIGCASARRS